MTEQPLTPKQSLELDRIARDELGLSDLVLMENAGLRCADWIVQNLDPGSVLVLCGSGNNGGDGLVIARQLAFRGIPTGVVMAGDESRMTPACRANWQVVQRWDSPELRLLAVDEASGFSGETDLIVDALLGISARGTPRPPMPELLGMANRATARRVAIDVPTGLDPETGAPGRIVFAAHWTLMMEGPKSLVSNPAAAPWIGAVAVIPLGLPAWVAKQAAVVA